MSVRSDFHHALETLQQDLLRMGSYVEEAISLSTKALLDQDRQLASQVIANDDRIDRLQHDVEERCMKLIALQQPMAKDLRKISSAWRISLELERMADNACGVAKSVRRIAEQPYVKTLVNTPIMSSVCQQMVKMGLDAYLQEDIELAIKMSDLDNQVDALYKHIFNDLLQLMLKDPSVINQATQLIFIARYLERFGDHATNIAETVVYLVTGERKELNP
ncbi:phosphate signaling complex protein PhoU [Heliophilum fasciatum]|uniref:Phosphate-specific transport system accessory protein PhoU n=1 Tax=Heliophilum fasciatum TaxID=35700 RepID=A0A4R2RI29_9FIRM|nr:phosphate signaling complex protein PhoU [Heliophilum fasciatum]MCW2278879.1 phosphate transport system protein [Heliophilum fasciatum]TCP62109.1 phosphate transport system protein [Heliophilum fasciatum]